MSSKIFTDFDDTMIPYSSGKALVKYYLFHGKGNFFFKLFRVLPFLARQIRLKQWNAYYWILGQIPLGERKKVLKKIPLNKVWLRKIERLRNKDGELKFSIISGNSIDVIQDWLNLHESDLKDNHLIVETIISNSQINSGYAAAVKKYHNHISILSFGRILSKNKKEFLEKGVIYLGDGPDEVIKPYVKEFIRV